MTTIESRARPGAKRAKSSTSPKRTKPEAAEKPMPKKSLADTKSPDGRQHAAPMTKHDRIVSLLSRADGATIPELMAATGWQQHSVRGFLAGTVKKKLGLALTSFKVNGEVRRYRIAPRRGR